MTCAGGDIRAERDASPHTDHEGGEVIRVDHGPQLIELFGGDDVDLGARTVVEELGDEGPD